MYSHAIFCIFVSLGIPTKKNRLSTTEYSLPIPITHLDTITTSNLQFILPIKYIWYLHRLSVSHNEIFKCVIFTIWKQQMMMKLCYVVADSIYMFLKKSEKELFNSHKQVMICFCLNERYGIITVLQKHVNWLELPDAPYHQWTSCFSIIKYTI